MQNDWVFISAAHEVYRRVYTDKATSSGQALRVFLSHRKNKDETGIQIATGIKAFIDSKTTMRNFFDSTDIPPGDNFCQRIEECILDAAFLAIQSDEYSASYWCQKEVVSAKKKRVPMIILDALDKGEDRSFPYLSNVPVIRVRLPLKEEDILYILSRLLLEAIRYRYVGSLFHVLSSWYGLEGMLFYSRVPELFELLQEEKGKVVAYYGGESLYPEEKELLETSSVKIKSIREFGGRDYNQMRMGISISEPSLPDLTTKGMSSAHLEHLARDTARFFMMRQAKLVYGGDLRQGGFTEFLFEEARILQDRMKTHDIVIENYIAWPIYNCDDEEIACWKARNINVARMKNVLPPDDVRNLISNLNGSLPPVGIQNRFVWSRCLTVMREEMIENCDVRLCAGGRTEGYLGSMPGVLEEILIAISKGKPVFLLGGFGGITERVCKMISDDPIPAELTYDWQEHHNSGYRDLRNLYRERHICFNDYDDVKKKITFRSLNNGLNVEENRRLFDTRYIEEVLFLVVKGLNQLGMMLNGDQSA